MRRLKAVSHGLLGLVVGAVVAGAAAHADAACLLSSISSKVKHVIFIQFDNAHFRRDNANVPSDLEQMPNLLNFIRNNGTLDTNHHAVLISHTANDIVTTLTGVYSDRHGIPVANSFGVFNAPGSATPVSFPPSFVYWTETVQDLRPATKDPLAVLLTRDPQGNLRNMPAPWVPFTRAGCDVGAYSIANIEFETIPGDVIKVFGSGSSQAKEDFNHQVADFQGVSVHCAKGSALCSTAHNGAPDTLPDEPGGYIGFNALFGAKYVAPAVGKPGGVTDLNGNVIKNADSGLVGFSGFDPSASQTLGYVATMQEAGIPVTFAYIADAHDDHVNDVAFGPGQAGYVAQLKAYDKAFGQFFAQLKTHGIDQSNTLFIFTADEGDHFAGGPPTPAGCDGVTTACSYSKIGEIDLSLNALAKLHGNSTSFHSHSDDAPTIYIDGDPTAADFDPDLPDPAARGLERTLSTLTAKSPITGATDKLMVAMADPVEERLLHMVTADPARTPNFTFFGDPDYFFASFATATPTEDPGFAWNHGDIQPEIGITWLGLVGPGVLNMGETADIFTDHTDVRPTILLLAGMKDDYTHDGRVLIEALDPLAVPVSLRIDSGTLSLLGQIYKQLNAPFGQLAQDSLKVSTAALSSNNNTTYAELEAEIAAWTSVRDGLVEQIKPLLEQAAFDGQPLNTAEAELLIDLGQDLLNEVHFIANP